MSSRRTESHFKPHRLFLIFLAVATLWRVWLPSPELPAAYGQIPDAGLQRKQVLDETRRTNQLLNELLRIVKTHTFKVRIAGTDKKTAPR